MAVKEKNRSTSIRDVPTGTLEERIARAREVQRRFMADRGQLIRRGPEAVDERGAELKAAASLAREARAELDRRAENRAMDELISFRRLRAAHPLRSVLQAGHPELVGVKLDEERLTRDELEELKALLKRRGRGEELTDDETRRYEAIVGRAAGDPELFTKWRTEEATMAELKARLKDLNLSLLPRRAKLAEPGSVGLPRECFEWLESSKDGRWTLTDLGGLVGFLFMFENETSLIRGATMERDPDGEPVLVGGELQDMRWPTGIDPQQAVRVAAVVTHLARNGWLETRREGSQTRIRRGERAMRLRRGSSTRGNAQAAASR